MIYFKFREGCIGISTIDRGDATKAYRRFWKSYGRPNKPVELLDKPRGEILDIISISGGSLKLRDKLVDRNIL